MTSNQLKVIFNTDGSIEKFEFPKYVTQGSNNVVKLIVALAGGNIQDYQVIARFRPTEEPTDQTNTLVFDTNESSVTVYGDVYPNAKSVLLTSAQTYFAGILYVSIEVLGNGGEVLYSYPCKITVNPTTYNPDSTDSRINNAQYENLVRELGEIASGGLVEKSLTDLTIADLYDEVGSVKILKYHLYGGTGEGYYIGVIAEYQGTYLFEFELYAGGSESKHRWTGIGVAGTTLVSNILSTASEYYKPYALQEKVVSSDYYLATGKTIKNLYDDLGFASRNNAKMIYFDGTATPGTFMVCIYKDIVDNVEKYSFEIEHYSGYLSPAAYRWVGALVSADTLLTDIIVAGNTYFASYALKSESVGYRTTAPTGNNPGTLEIVVLDEEPATKYNGYLYIITGSSNS